MSLKDTIVQTGVKIQSANANTNAPRKKAHNIAGRILVIIDESLVKRFSILEDNTWFSQEATDDGILLRIYRQ